MAPPEIALVPDPDDVTPDWLTAVLRRAGALPEGRVESFEPQAVGTGQVGDSIRFHLTYDDADAGPPTVVGKFPAKDETSRATGTATRTYEVETSFYAQLQHRVDITTPKPYISLFDPSSHDFVIVMNDLAPAEQGDQLRGCTADEAALAMEEAAKLHAPVWGDRSLASLPWLNRFSPEGVQGYSGLIGMLWPGFLERYDGRVDPEVAAAGNELMPRLVDYMNTRPEPHTAVHGDFRVDNMLFGTPAGGAPLTTVDWQTVSLGAGPADAAYFIGTSVPTETRASSEEDLVREYHRTLLAGGVRDYPWDACWTSYRLAAFSGFLMAVSASMIVGQTDRGDEMFMAMANRSGRMAIELETLGLF